MASTGGTKVPIETGSERYGKPVREAAARRAGKTYGKTGGTKAPSEYVPQAVRKTPFNIETQRPKNG